MYQTASLAVDPQKGFTPVCPLELPVPEGDEIAAHLNFMASFAQLHTASKDWHCEKGLWVANEQHPQLSPLGIKDADVYWNRHCIGGTEGAEFIDGLPPVEDFDFIAYKGMEPQLHPYSACYHDLAGTKSTGLIEWYRQNHVENVVVGGLAYEFCVKETVLHLVNAGFNVLLYAPAVRGIYPELIKKAAEEMVSKGAVIVETAEQLQVLLSKDR
jgi:nicotinamidase/pyrazinamidase